MSHAPSTPAAHTALHVLLAAAVLLWIGAMVRAGFALGELADIRHKSEERAKRIQSLNPEFRTLVIRDLAMQRLLSQAFASPQTEGTPFPAIPEGAPSPRLSTRLLPTNVGGHPLREITATWESVPSETLASALHDAESASPPLRLRRIEISPRPGDTLAATAVFETL